MNEKTKLTDLRMFNGDIFATYSGPSAALADFFHKLYSRIGNAPGDLEVEIAANMVPVSEVMDSAKQAGLVI